MTSLECKIIAAVLFIFGAFLGHVLPINGSIYSDGKEAMARCEAELPRNQHCVITAIPEARDETDN